MHSKKHLCRVALSNSKVDQFSIIIGHLTCNRQSPVASFLHALYWSCVWITCNHYPNNIILIIIQWFWISKYLWPYFFFQDHGASLVDNQTFVSIWSQECEIQVSHSSKTGKYSWSTPVHLCDARIQELRIDVREDLKPEPAATRLQLRAFLQVMAVCEQAAHLYPKLTTYCGDVNLWKTRGHCILTALLGTPYIGALGIGFKYAWSVNSIHPPPLFYFVKNGKKIGFKISKLACNLREIQ